MKEIQNIWNTDGSEIKGRLDGGGTMYFLKQLLCLAGPADSVEAVLASTGKTFSVVSVHLPESSKRNVFMFLARQFGLGVSKHPELDCDFIINITPEDYQKVVGYMPN